VASDAASAGRIVAALRARGDLPRLAEAARALAAPRAADRVVDVALRLVDGGAAKIASRLPLAA
jgi:hypothetical protein